MAPPPPPRPYTDDYSYQSQYMRLVPEKGVILDLASGHNPFPKATILCDRYLEITAHRREEIKLDDRPFVILDMHHLPFKNKSIDYIYCSHVIEHSSDPAQACREMMRVARAGYIETPTLMKDALFAWAKDMSHNWHVLRFANSLLFFEYDEQRQRGIGSEQWAKQVLGDVYHPNQDIYYRNLGIFNTILEWKDGFNVMVFRQSADGRISIQRVDSQGNMSEEIIPATQKDRVSR
ncbi:MAG: class I SAM-dependent methyltransferase [Candidatus Sumerlaeota bacterium]|nr:class I SAM-dependent methyltransferase [Candidatus Sumerlaeota bacterium]